MCRLLAYLGDPIETATLVFSGSHSLYEQSWAPRELLSGSVNADGYGVTWYTGGLPRPDCGHEADLARRGPPELAPGDHGPVRRGGAEEWNSGHPLDPSGVLPLVFERWTFALNGFVPDFRARHMRGLRASLPDDLYGHLAGSSDSETLFFLCVEEVRNGASLQEALMSTARLVYARLAGEEAQLNMVLTDGASIGVLRSANVTPTNSLYVADRQPFAPGGVVLASEPLDGDSEWVPVAGHSWLRIESDGSRTSGAFPV